LNLVFRLFSVANSRKECSIIVRGVVLGRYKANFRLFRIRSSSHSSSMDLKSTFL
ncbi:hypothetical protein JCM6882_001688, partial [Rhodosporidiobolus microsporus]